MGFNKKVLSKAVSELGKAKAPGKPKDIIVDPAGQWKYPGQKTRIPSSNITMQGVNYPVFAQPNVGPGTMMYPNQDYQFPGADYVDETPLAKKGGTLQSKKYSKNMSATNKLFAKNKLFQNKKSKIFDPNAKFKSGGSKLGPINLNPNPLSHYELNYGFNLPVKQDGGESDYEELELTDDEIQAYKDGGYVVEELPEAQDGLEIYTYSGRPGSYYKKDKNNKWLISNKGTGNEFVPIQDPKGTRAKVLNEQAQPLGMSSNKSAIKDNVNDPRFMPVAESTRVNNVYKNQIPNFNKNIIVDKVNESNKKQKEATIKKAINTNQKVKNYYKEYHNSPRYLEMLKESSPGYWSDFKTGRNINLSGLNIDNNSINSPRLSIHTIQPSDSPLTGGFSESGSGNISLLPEGYNVKGLLPHEWSHSIDRPFGNTNKSILKNNKTGNQHFRINPNIRLIPASDADWITKHRAQDYFESPQFLRQTSSDKKYDLEHKNDLDYKNYIDERKEWYNYVGEPTETRARLNDIRYQSKERGIYDPFTQKVDGAILKKLLNTKFENDEEEGFDALKQLKDVYTDEQIQWMLNHISENQDQQESDITQGYGQIGGYVQHELVKAQKGLEQSDSDVYTYAGRPDSYYKKDDKGQWFISNKGTGNKFIPIEDPKGTRAKILNAQAKKNVPMADSPYALAASNFANNKGTDSKQAYIDKYQNSPELAKQKVTRQFKTDKELAKTEALINSGKLENPTNTNQPIDPRLTGPASDNTKMVSGFNGQQAFESGLRYNSPESVEERKRQADWKKQKWDEYNKMSLYDKVLDRTQAFAAHPLLMTGNVLAGDQGYIPGMGRGLLNKDNPEEYDRYLRATGQKKGAFEVNDLFNMINPTYWAANAGNELHKGNYVQGVTELGLGALGMGQGRNLLQGGKYLIDDVTKGANYLGKTYDRLGTGNFIIPYTERAGLTGNKKLSGAQNIYVPKSVIENPTVSDLESHLQKLGRTGNGGGESINSSLKDKLYNFIKTSLTPIDEDLIMPLRYNSSIKKAKKYIADQKEYFKIPEVRAKLIDYGIDPDKLEKINFKIGNTGSYSHNNQIQFDPREMKQIQKLGIMLDENTVMAHELGHSLGYNAEDNVKYFTPNTTIKNLPINKDLYQEVIKNNYKYGDPAHQLEYFTQRLNKRIPEAYPHLREMKQNMINNGIINRLDEPVSEKQLMEFFSHNYATGKDRISSMVDKANPELIKYLSRELSNARVLIPTIGLGAVGAGTLQQEKDGGITDAWEDELDDEEIARLKRAGYVVEEVDQYQTGGPTVSELWKQHTGTSWNEARKLGLTSGSYEDNMKLRNRILNNEFNGITPQPQQVTQQVAQPVRNNVSAEEHKAQYIHNVKNLINNNKTIDDLVNMKVGTREGLLKLFPELSGSNTGNVKPVVKKQPVSDPRRSAQVSPEATNLERYMKLTPLQIKFAEIKKLNDAKKINDAKKLSNAEKLSEANKLKQKEKVIKKEIKSEQWKMPNFNSSPNLNALGINTPDISKKAISYNQNKTVADNFNVKGNTIPERVKSKALPEANTYYNKVIAPAANAIKEVDKKIDKIGEDIKNSKVAELYESLQKEGLANTISQVITSQEAPKTYKTIVVPKTVKPVKKEQEKFDADDLANDYNNIVDAGNYTISTFSKKLRDAPLAVRNRGDESDIKGRAIAYTYSPFKTYEQHLNNEYGSIKLRPNDTTTDNQPVIVYDNNKMYIDTFKNQKNTGKLISPTYKTNSVTDLVIDPGNRYHEGIEQKMMKLKTETGTKDIPIGISDSDSETFKDWSGGHLMIENPKTKEVVVLHGKSNELRDMFRKYLKENNLKSANIIETDHKAYSLIKNPKNNILTSEFNKARDNANTNSSGSGNFIYIRE